MTGRAARCLAAAILALGSAVAMVAQTQDQAMSVPVAPTQTAPAQATPAPVMPAANEIFPPSAPAKPENPWSRFEIVSLGSFPIMLFYTGFVFDLGRFVVNGFNAAYAPWPFQGTSSAALTTSDRLTRIGAALGSSLVVGAVDAYLHATKLKKAARLREAARNLDSASQ